MFAKACAFADRKKNAGLTTPDDIIRFDDISYGPDPVWNLLDVYRPRAAEGPLPVIIDVHGGGWVYGDKFVYQYYCMELAQHGFAVVNFSYRLAPENVFPASMQDMDAVVRFVLSMYSNMCTDNNYAKTLGVIPPEGFVPSAVVLNCGVYDICEMLKDQNPSVLLLKPLVRDLLGVKAIPETLSAEQDALLCPVKYINGRFPAAFVMTAIGDFLVRQPECILPQLERNGVRHAFKVYGSEENKLHHVFHCEIRTAEAKQCNDEEMAFLLDFVKGE